MFPLKCLWLDRDALGLAQRQEGSLLVAVRVGGLARLVGELGHLGKGGVGRSGEHVVVEQAPEALGHELVVAAPGEK